MGCAICQSPPFIFTHIPKTGGTSFLSRRSPVRRYLDPHCEGLTVMNGHLYLRTLKTDISKYFKFSIVRNPYDPFISLWKVRTPKDDLDYFINHVRNNPWYQIKPQCKWIGTRGGEKLLTDHIIRYENYEDGINSTLNKLGLPRMKLPHLRASNRDRDYRKYYTNSSHIEFVQKLYDLDFKHFNYSKGDI